MPKPNPWKVPTPITAEWYRRVYLTSNHWRWRKEMYTKFMGFYCENQCGRLGTELHHLSYANLYCEANADLMLLCRPCHEKMHRWPKAANDNEQIEMLFEALDKKKTGSSEA